MIQAGQSSVCRRLKASSLGNFCAILPVRSCGSVETRPMTFIIFMAFGAVIGWLAGQRAKGAGYGAVTDAAIGAIGGLIGGWLLAEIGIAGAIGYLLSLVAAIVGAIVLVTIVRIVRTSTVAG
jgi:uncharacterized membrane protein YeaQ/YmgE (transglycosylase-associated protein family)